MRRILWNARVKRDYRTLLMNYSMIRKKCGYVIRTWMRCDHSKRIYYGNGRTACDRQAPRFELPINTYPYGFVTVVQNESEQYMHGNNYRIVSVGVSKDYCLGELKNIYESSRSIIIILMIFCCFVVELITVFFSYRKYYS